MDGMRYFKFLNNAVLNSYIFAIGKRSIAVKGKDGIKYTIMEG